MQAFLLGSTKVNRFGHPLLCYLTGKLQPGLTVYHTFSRFGMASRKNESLTVSAGISGALHSRTCARQTQHQIRPTEGVEGTSRCAFRMLAYIGQRK